MDKRIVETGGLEVSAPGFGRFKNHRAGQRYTKEPDRVAGSINFLTIRGRCYADRTE